jgi:putative hydrolase of the HAD superfamily
MPTKIATRIVTFDAGQTLVELDLDFLAARAATRGVAVAPRRLAAAMEAAWRRYDERVDAGERGQEILWRGLITDILVGGGADSNAAAPVVDWLWQQQPTHNLFRRPIADMVAVARALAGHARVAVISNSEGKLAELLTSIGIADAFEVIVDSGVVGIEKPDPGIFDYTLDALGLRRGDATDAIHIGDSWSADVAGALGVGWQAIWYGRRATSATDPRVHVARDAAGVRAALVDLGALAKAAPA